MLWFFGDPHFHHANIIKYSKRPFKHVTEMNDTIIQNINDVVTERDLLYCLGDWCWAYDKRQLLRIARELRDRIKCRDVRLIYGNHDREEIKSVFTTARDMERVKYNDNGEQQEIVLCHYAMRVWNKSHHGAWHLYGHSHGSLKDDPHSLSFDVGVDCHDYKPVSYDQVKAIMSKKVWKPIDHHGARDHE